MLRAEGRFDLFDSAEFFRHCCPTTNERVFVVFHFDKSVAGYDQALSHTAGINGAVYPLGLYGPPTLCSCSRRKLPSPPPPEFFLREAALFKILQIAQNAR